MYKRSALLQKSGTVSDEQVLRLNKLKKAMYTEFAATRTDGSSAEKELYAPHLFLRPLSQQSGPLDLTSERSISDSGDRILWPVSLRSILPQELRELRSERTLTQYWEGFRNLRNQYISSLDTRSVQQDAGLSAHLRRNIQLIEVAMAQISTLSPDNYRHQAWQHFMWEDHLEMEEPQQQEEREPDNDDDFDEET